MTDQQSLARNKSRSKNMHTGATDKVRAAFETGPKTIAQLAKITGLPEHLARRYVHQLCTTTGGVTRIGHTGLIKIYALIGHTAKPVPDQPAGSVAIAAPITIGRGFKWGAI